MLASGSQVAGTGPKTHQYIAPILTTFKKNMASTAVNFASGTEQSRTVRFYQDLKDPLNDVTWINETSNILTTDINGQPIDFNKDGLTDALFLDGLVTESIGYTSNPKSFLVSCTRAPPKAKWLSGAAGKAVPLSASSIFQAAPGYAPSPRPEA